MIGSEVLGKTFSLLVPVFSATDRFEARKRVRVTRLYTYKSGAQAVDLESGGVTIREVSIDKIAKIGPAHYARRGEALPLSDGGWR